MKKMDFFLSTIRLEMYLGTKTRNIVSAIVIFMFLVPTLGYSQIGMNNDIESDYIWERILGIEVKNDHLWLETENETSFVIVDGFYLNSGYNHAIEISNTQITNYYAEDSKIEIFETQVLNENQINLRISGSNWLSPVDGEYLGDKSAFRFDEGKLVFYGLTEDNETLLVPSIDVDELAPPPPIGFAQFKVSFHRSQTDFKSDPAWGRYDRVDHKYLQSYIEPDTYWLHLDACQQFQIEHGFIPDPIEEWVWKIERIGGSFSTEHRLTVRDTPNDEKCSTQFPLPGLNREFSEVSQNPGLSIGQELNPAKYRITLTVHGQDKIWGTSSQVINLRGDALIVSVGDSYASGEGSPDMPAVIRTIYSSILPVSRESYEIYMNATAIPELYRSMYGYYQLYNMMMYNIDSKDMMITEQCYFNRAEKILDEILPETESEAVWLEPNGHRSLRSAPALAAKDIELKMSNNEYGMLKGITFLSFANSGAKSQNLYSDPQQPEWQSMPQLLEVKEAVGNRKIDALVISIGGNDALLSDVLKTMANYGSSSGIRKAAGVVAEYIEERLATIDQFIRENLNVSKVYLTEYPVSHFDGEDEIPQKGCDVFYTVRYLGLVKVGIEADEALAFKNGAIELNQAMKDGLPDGWTFIDGIADQFSGHGYCTSDDVSYFRRAGSSCFLQGNWDGTMHPNAAGQAVMATEIRNSILRHTFGINPPDEDIKPFMWN